MSTPPASAPRYVTIADLQNGGSSRIVGPFLSQAPADACAQAMDEDLSSVEIGIAAGIEPPPVPGPAAPTLQTDDLPAYVTVANRQVSGLSTIYGPFANAVAAGPTMLYLDETLSDVEIGLAFGIEPPPIPE